MLGELKKIQLRKIWKNEAYDFTPWLSNNLDHIGDATGLELEFDSSEVSVGPFSADILARDTATDKYVVIENQLEKTNHDHLGKCITYASVLDASAVIWIASRFTDEHKKALDWLNDHTSDQIGFYGIKVELWQIDESQPAVKLNVVSEPNIAVRQAAKNRSQGELSDSKKLQFEFWTDFKEKLEASGKIRSIQTPGPKYWFNIALGKSGIHLSNTFNTDSNEIGIRVYIRGTKSEEWLPYFESKKNEIESKIGEKLEWNPTPHKDDKVIKLTKYFDLDSDENWDAALNWLTEHSIKFKETFSYFIKQKGSK